MARDPEISGMTLDSIKIISRAERLLIDLNQHQDEMQEFLNRATGFVERRTESSAIPGGRRFTDPHRQGDKYA